MPKSLLLLSVSGGFLSGLSFNYPPFSFLVWFSLIPFIYVIEKSPPKYIVMCSLSCGFTFFLTVLFWVGYVSKLGALALVTYLSIYWGIFGWLGKKLIKRPFKFLSLPSLWVVLEFIRENTLLGGFGWAIMGYSQHKNIFLIQPVDLLGTKFISWLIILSNVTFFDILRKRKIFIRESILFFILIAFSIIYSQYKLNNLKEVSSVKLSLVQPNIPQKMKWDPIYYEVILKRLKRLGGKASSDSLVIYPEASYPLVINQDNYNQFLRLFKGIGESVLVGGIEKDKGKFYNAGIFLDENGKVIKKYRKLKLVPFGEYVPLRKFLKFIKVLNTIGDMSPGEGKEKFKYKDKKFSVFICFEDLFPFLVREFAEDVDFLVNITNDAWFRGEPQATQHLGIMTLRAIENRISIVRVANTGITGWVSFSGVINSFKKDNRQTFFEGVFNTRLPINRRRSFYNRFPEIIVLLGVVFLAIPFKKKFK